MGMMVIGLVVDLNSNGVGSVKVCGGSDGNTSRSSSTSSNNEW